MSYVDVPLEWWRTEVLAKVGLPPHTEEHIATMARLHRENRYDRASDDVERVMGVPAQTIEAFVAAHQDFYLEAEPHWQLPALDRSHRRRSSDVTV
ncbi:hypothetical protein SHIRM173S_07597 [Streptomyces hirsutus]